MLVDYFLTNEQNAPTTEFYQFTKEVPSVMNGEYIQHNGQFYQVTGQLLASEPKANHNAFVYPVNRRPVEIHV